MANITSHRSDHGSKGNSVVDFDHQEKDVYFLSSEPDDEQDPYFLPPSSNDHSSSSSVFTTDKNNKGNGNENHKDVDISSSEYPDQHDEICMICSKGGTLLLCELCPRCVHMKCHDPPLHTVPKEDFVCAVCANEETTRAGKKQSSGKTNFHDENTDVRPRALTRSTSATRRQPQIIASSSIFMSPNRPINRPRTRQRKSFHHGIYSVQQQKLESSASRKRKTDDTSVHSESDSEHNATTRLGKRGTSTRFGKERTSTRFTKSDSKTVPTQQKRKNEQKIFLQIHSDVESSHEDDCMVCGRRGQLLMCDRCPRSIHLDCNDPPLRRIPPGDYICPECQQHDKASSASRKRNMTSKLTKSIPKTTVSKGNNRKWSFAESPKRQRNLKEFDTDSDQNQFKLLPRHRTKRKSMLATPKVEQLDMSSDDDGLSDSQHDENCMVCRTSGGTLLCCDFCAHVVHLQCNDPPLSKVPPDDFACHTCRKDQRCYKVDKVLASRYVSKQVSQHEPPSSVLHSFRPLDHSSTQNLPVEFYIKQVDKSHHHNVWIPEKALIYLAKPKLSAFLRHRPHPFIDDEVDEVTGFKYGVNPEWLQAERVVSHRTQGDSTQYLVKWCSLPYASSTWEDKELVLRLFPKELDQFNKTLATGERSRHYADRPNKFKSTDSDHPPFLNQEYSIYKYQIDGYNWIRFNWFRLNSVILADEMGLGKTIQTIAFIASIADNGWKKPHLIIAPLVTVPNWYREFSIWAPHLNAVVYGGTADDRRFIKEYEFKYPGKRKGLRCDVIITSYDQVIMDQQNSGSSLLRIGPFQTLTIDEGHRLKAGDSSKLFRIVARFETVFRLLLTGTPLQNNLSELFALLSFLDPDKYSPDDVPENIQSEQDLEKLHSILKPKILRRTKDGVGLEIPPKREILVNVPLSPFQRKCYQVILSKNVGLLRNSGKGSLNFILMELRKCCNHPYLVSELEPQSLSAEESLRLLIAASGKLTLLNRMLMKLKEKGHRVLLFSQFTRTLDIIEDYLVAKGFKDAYERIDGSVVGSERQQKIDRFNAQNSTKFIFLISTRAGGLGINLATADTIIIYDSDWNPQNDLQAAARAHRIGQKNEVIIYRFCTKNSVEEKIIQRARSKLALEEAVVQKMNEDKNKSVSKEEVLEAIKHGAVEILKEDTAAVPTVEDAEREMTLSDDALEKLLDRSDKKEQEKETNMAKGGLFESYDSAAVWKQSEDGKIKTKEEAMQEELFWEEILKERSRKMEEENMKALGRGKRIKRQVMNLAEVQDEFDDRKDKADNVLNFGEPVEEFDDPKDIAFDGENIEESSSSELDKADLAHTLENEVDLANHIYRDNLVRLNSANEKLVKGMDMPQNTKPFTDLNDKKQEHKGYLQQIPVFKESSEQIPVFKESSEQIPVFKESSAPKISSPNRAKNDHIPKVFVDGVVVSLDKPDVQQDKSLVVKTVQQNKPEIAKPVRQNTPESPHRNKINYTSKVNLDQQDKTVFVKLVQPNKLEVPKPVQPNKSEAAKSVRQNNPEIVKPVQHNQNMSGRAHYSSSKENLRKLLPLNNSPVTMKPVLQNHLVNGDATTRGTQSLTAGSIAQINDTLPKVLKTKRFFELGHVKVTLTTDPTGTKNHGIPLALRVKLQQSILRYGFFDPTDKKKCPTDPLVKTESIRQYLVALQKALGEPMKATAYFESGIARDLLVEPLCHHQMITSMCFFKLAEAKVRNISASSFNFEEKTIQTAWKQAELGKDGSKYGEWNRRYHDYCLMRSILRHGWGRYNDIIYDKEHPVFPHNALVKSNKGIKFPNQEVLSAANAINHLQNLIDQRVKMLTTALYEESRPYLNNLYSKYMPLPETYIHLSSTYGTS